MKTQKTQETSMMKPAPVVLKPKQRLTTPIFSMAKLVILTIQALGELIQDQASVSGNNQRPDTWLRVLDLSSNIEGLLVVSAPIEEAFNKIDGSLEGRYFQLKADQFYDNGQRIRTVDVVEMEVNG